MAATRLSPLDDSFLGVESATAHMHVGWASLFEPPPAGGRPTFDELRGHIESRLHRAPRYRQRLAGAPLGLDAPCWVDDPDFDLDRHVKRASSPDLDAVVEECMSRQLDRERPLWEVCVSDRLADGRLGVVGKAHHCMVDGIAAVELASLLLDPSPEAPAQPPDEWTPAPAPSTLARLTAGAGETVRAAIGLGGQLSRLALPPRRLLAAARLGGAARVLARGARPVRPVSPLNEPISSGRVLARVQRPFAELRAIKEHFGVTINDVYLAIAAGAVRRLLIDRDREPQPLKTMVPVSVRGDGRADALGNQISFMFVDLPCDEPHPVRRLERVRSATADAKQAGEAGATSSLLELIGYAPRPVRRLVAHAMASPRMFNLVVSNIPGPTEPMFMLGCRLAEAYPVVPLADRHALSMGMTTVGDQACFGLYADRKSRAAVHSVAASFDSAADELLERSGAVSSAAFLSEAELPSPAAGRQPFRG